MPDSSGPSRLTILERLVGLLRLPYSIGCLVFAAVLGGPGFFVLFYLDSSSIDAAWRQTVSEAAFSVSPVSQTVPAIEGLLDVMFYTASLFVFMQAVRYWRLRVASTEAKISPLSTSGRVAFDRAFGAMASAKGSLSLALLLTVLYLPERVHQVTGIFSLLGLVIIILLNTVVFATLFWVYLSGLWGLYKFGLEPLNLKSFYEDRMLGLRPLGQISFSFASSFFVVMILLLGGGILSGDIYTLTLALGILALSLMLLFLPLRGIHRKMALVKEEEEASLRSRRKVVLSTSRNQGTENQQGTSNIEELLKLQVLTAEVSSIPEWPFEPRRLERLIGVVLAVFTVIVARILALIA